ncbi:MAG TPA: hypothetical protein VOA80_10645, partial [Thermoanaerobaculia bacterium]|nr:hypothetical protein [Thermoanaerobaculia bacterium]
MLRQPLRRRPWRVAGVSRLVAVATADLWLVAASGAQPAGEDGAGGRHCGADLGAGLGRDVGQHRLELEVLGEGQAGLEIDGATLAVE